MTIYESPDFVAFGALFQDASLAARHFLDQDLGWRLYSITGHKISMQSERLAALR
jgi:hypothetical protein